MCAWLWGRYWRCQIYSVLPAFLSGHCHSLLLPRPPWECELGLGTPQTEPMLIGPTEALAPPTTSKIRGRRAGPWARYHFSSTPKCIEKWKIGTKCKIITHPGFSPERQFWSTICTGPLSRSRIRLLQYMAFCFLSSFLTHFLPFINLFILILFYMFWSFSENLFILCLQR